MNPSTFFWRAAILGSIACAIMLVGVGVFMVDQVGGVVLVLLSLPAMFLSWKNNAKYRELMEGSVR